MISAKFVGVASALVFALGATGCGVQDGSNPAGGPLVPSGGNSQPAGDANDASAAQIKAANLAPCPRSDPSVPAVSDGLPDLTLKCLGGGPVVRLAGLRGRPLVVNVWASWCGPCREELPMMGQAARTFTGVEFLGIDLADSRSAALEMAKSSNMGFPSVMDPESLVRADLRIIGVPSTFFVRADGSIAGRVSLIEDQDQLAGLTDRYLGVKQS